MPIPAWEDPDDFLNLNDFAVPAIITLAAGGTMRLNGIFDDPYINAELGEYERDTQGPRFTCKATDVVGVRRGDRIAITFPAGVESFDIMTSPQPEGTGFAKLELTRP